jgi:ferredoxin-NADP reductase
MKPISCNATVVSYKNLTPSVFEIAFETEPSITFEGGQFVSIIIPEAGPQGRNLRRAYSIASSPQKRPIELCIKKVENGPGTQYLSQLRAKNTFQIMAPYGDFTYQPEPTSHICFVATGTGIAPFRSMLLSEKFTNHPPLHTYCFLGVRTQEELLYQEDFQQKNITLINTISQNRDHGHFKGRVTDYLKTLDASFPWLQTQYYLCGHGGMIQEVKALLTEKGVAKPNMHQEVYYK